MIQMARQLQHRAGPISAQPPDDRGTVGKGRIDLDIGARLRQQIGKRGGGLSLAAGRTGNGNQPPEGVPHSIGIDPGQIVLRFLHFFDRFFRFRQRSQLR